MHSFMFNVIILDIDLNNLSLNDLRSYSISTKKKVTISGVDNIIPDIDVALEIGKSISLTKVTEEEAARKVHATHARIVTKSIPEPIRRRPSGIAFRDTSRVSKKVSSDSSKKLKGVQSLTPKELEAINTMQALKESKKTSRRQPGTEGSSEETGRTPGVPNESTVVFATSSEGTSTKLGVVNEEKVTSEENDEEKKDDVDDDKSINLEMTDDEETEDEFVQGDEQVNYDENEEMKNAKVDESRKGDEENIDAAKADAEKTKEVKDDAKKAELPPTSSSLSDTTDAQINSLLDIKIQYEVPHVQSSSVFTVPISVISKPSVITPLQESHSVAPITTLPPLFVSTIPHVPHQTTAPIPTPPITTDAPTITIDVLESDALFADVSKLKKINHSTKALATLKSQVPTVVDNYLGTKFGDVLQKELQKHTANLIQKYYVKPARSDHEDPLAKPNKGKKTKRRRTKESESSKKPSTTKETSKGKASLKSSKTGKSATAKETIKEPTTEDKASKQDWFKQPPRPPTFNLEKNNYQVVLDQPKQSWFNQMVSATKDPLTFNDLMATPIDFSKYVLNRLQIDHLTQEILVGPSYNLLKRTCTSSIELEYNMEEFFKALTDRPDWNNPKGDCCPFDLTKPLSLKGRPGHLTIAAKYFFNNDIEFLKSFDPNKKHTTSITKTKAA
nr:hypothetical protein [Tanacetum cinerariifolium]